MLKKLFFCAFSALPCLIYAQVGIQMELNRKDFMLHEPIYACVTLRNDSGKALLFGENPKLQGFILFDIRDTKNNRILQKENAEINVSGLFLGPGEVRSITFPLNHYYNLDKTGSYQVRVYVSHNLLDGEYQSKQVSFLRIHTGVEVWRTTVGLPDLTGSNPGPSKSRSYSVRALDVNGERNYYLVVEDKFTVYGVSHIGHQYSQNELQIQTDMLSRIHLLVPMSHRVYHYLAFDLDGNNIENSYWKKGATIPGLYRDPSSGKVSRLGGDPARAGVDFKVMDQNRLTVQDINKKYIDAQPAVSGGIVDIGRHVGKDRD